MLHEFKGASQEKTGFRRIFIGDYFDLFVWYESRGGRLKGFELSYNKDVDEHSIIWKENQGWIHAKVDTGEDAAGKMKKTPVLVDDGIFNFCSVAKRFKIESSKIDQDIAKLVYDKLLMYQG